MNRIAILGLASVVVFGTVGCNTQSRIAGHSPGFSAPRAAPTYALAVTVDGGLQPTPRQWAAIQAKVADELSWRGAVLVSDLSLAERIIRLDFRPNPSDPENSGHITVLGVRINPYYGTARSGVLASAYSPYSTYGSLSHFSMWGSSNFYSGDYYNYMGPWENGYTSGGTVTVIPKPTTKPPHRHDRNDREICPPDALHPRPTPSYASTEVRSMSSGSTVLPAYTSPEPTRGRWNGERSAWRSEAAANRPMTTYASSAPTGSRGDRGYSRSDRTASRSDSSSSDSSWWRSRSSDSYRSSDYSSYSSSSSYSSGSLSASSSHVTPTYTSPEPSYSSSSSSSGSLSTSSSSSSSSSVSTTESSNTAER